MKQEECIIRSFNLPIEHNSALAELFNRILKSLDMVRIISRPTHFLTEGKTERALLFYEVCLCELYFHRVIEKLNMWMSISNKYQSEFKSSWKYYALSKRLSTIKKYGGDDDDYNDDGSIKDKVDDESLRQYSVLESLVSGEVDIVTDTYAPDLDTIFSMIKTESGLSTVDILSKFYGADIPIFRQDASGNMIKQDWVDNTLAKAENQDRADITADMLMRVVVNIQSIVLSVKELNPLCDNESFFPWLDARIDGLFNLELEPLEHKNESEV